MRRTTNHALGASLPVRDMPKGWKDTRASGSVSMDVQNSAIFSASASSGNRFGGDLAQKVFAAGPLGGAAVRRYGGDEQVTSMSAVSYARIAGSGHAMIISYLYLEKCRSNLGLELSDMRLRVDTWCFFVEK